VQQRAAPRSAAYVWTAHNTYFLSIWRPTWRRCSGRVCWNVCRWTASTGALGSPSSQEDSPATCTNRRTTLTTVFTARRYGSAVYTVVVCVRQSITSPRCIETTGRIVFGTEASFHLAHTVLQRHSGISKIRVLSSGTLTKTLENFATANRSSCQQYSSTVELVDDIYNGRRVVAIYYTSNNCNLIITLSLGFVLDFSRYSFL